MPQAFLRNILFAYLAVVCGLIASAILVAVVPGAGGQGWLGRTIGEPIWAVEMTAGFLLGWWCNRNFPSPTALWVWVVPGIFLLVSVLNWRQTMAGYDSTWDTFFGTDCSGSECLYELFLTAPFYTAILYSVGAAFGRRSAQPSG